MKTVNHFIDGKVYSDKKSRKGPIFNPAIGEQIAEVELASKATVEMAIESSAKAFLKWSKTTPINRARILSKYKDLLIKNMEELAVMVSEQHGKLSQMQKVPCKEVLKLLNMRLELQTH